MTAEELQSEWRLWDVVNNVGSPRPYSPASASFCKFVVDVVIPREQAKAVKAQLDSWREDAGWPRQDLDAYTAAHREGTGTCIADDPF